MVIVKAKVLQHVWDNYQGASGKIVERTVMLKLEDETPIGDIHKEIIDYLDRKGIVDNWEQPTFLGRGLIEICIE